MPHPLQQSICTIRRQHNRRVTAECTCWLVAVVAVGLLAMGLADYLVRPADRGLRVLMSAALAGTLVAACWRLLAWYRLQLWSDFKAAQAVQQAFPQLGDRLASALEFLRQDEHHPTAGSAAMRRAVVAETTATLEHLGNVGEGVARRNRSAAVAAVAALAVGGMLLVLAPTVVQTAIVRLVAPFGGTEWPRHNDLAFTGGPAVVARGEAFEASLVDRGGMLPEQVAIEYRYRDDGRWRTEERWMKRVGDTMVARRENVQRSFEYRATGGDHQTMAWREVQVVDPPEAVTTAVDIHPPAYTGLSTTRARTSARVLAGSEIELAARANQPLTEATVYPAGEEGQAINAEVTGDERRSILLPRGTWQIDEQPDQQNLRPQLRLTAENGLTASVPLPRLEVIADEPPTVRWRAPVVDLDVVAGAQVPMAVQARDNLALREVTLALEVTSAGDNTASQASSVPLYQADDGPPARDALPRSGEMLDERQAEHVVDLGAWELEPGAIVTLEVTATDFKPQSATAASPRRLTIITTAELESQVAADQAEILRLLEQALADQRGASDQVAEFANATRDGGTVARQWLDQLLATRLQQQEVRHTLTAPDNSAIDLVQRIVERLHTNGLDRGELLAQLQTIEQELSRLDQGPLGVAEQRLTELRKELDTADDLQTTGSRLSTLDQAQREIIRTLEALIERANAWSDADRFIRELARLEQEQRDLRSRTLDAARQQIRAAADAEAPEIAPDVLQQLSESQSDLGRRYDKLAEAMRQFASRNATSSAVTDRLRDALGEAESRGLSSQIARAWRQLDADQLARAGETQSDVAEVLRDMLDRLRDQSPTDPAALAEELRELQQQLADMQQQASAAAAESNRERQAARQQQLTERLQRAARDLARLSAPAAGRSAEQASEHTAPEADQSQADANRRLSDAQRDIQRARQQLAERIAQLEAEQQLRLLDRLAQVLDELIPRQRQTLEETVRLELVRETTASFGPEEVRRAAEIAADQADVADELTKAMGDLARRAVFQLALGGASDDMQQASRALERGETGRVTQDLELGALTRLRHVRDLLRETPPQGDQPPSSGQGDGGGGQPQGPPLIELAEVKMLRWLQADLNRRTRRFEGDVDDNAEEAAQRREVAQRLAAEQRRLEELVREMMRRNNEQSGPEIDL